MINKFEFKNASSISICITAGQRHIDQFKYLNLKHQINYLFPHGFPH